MESSENLRTEVCDKLTACENIKDTSAADDSEDMETDLHRYPEKIMPNTFYRFVSDKKNRSKTTEMLPQKQQ